MLVNSSAPKQPHRFRFSELPHLSSPNSTATKRSHLGDLGDNSTLATKFCALVCRDTAWLGLVLCNFSQLGCGFLTPSFSWQLEEI